MFLTHFWRIESDDTPCGRTILDPDIDVSGFRSSVTCPECRAFLAKEGA